MGPSGPVFDMPQSFASQGLGVSISKIATGKFALNFAPFGAGNFQVAAYGSDSNRCKFESITSPGPTVVCTTRAGVLADTPFVISYTNDFKYQPGVKPYKDPAVLTGGTRAAFLQTTQASGSSIAITSSFNSSEGSANTAQAAPFWWDPTPGPGRYVATLPGLNTASGNVQVTAIGSDPGTYCKNNGWENFFGDIIVGVLCYNSVGAPTNSMFSLQYVEQAQGELWDRAYVSLDQPNAAFNVSFTPALVWNSNSLVDPPVRPSNAIGANTAVHTATGKYKITFPRFGALLSTVVVGAIGGDVEDAVYCKPVGWAQQGTAAEVTVSCWLPNGVLTDSAVSVTYLRQENRCRSKTAAGTTATGTDCPNTENPPGLSRRPFRDADPALRGYVHTNLTPSESVPPTSEMYGPRTETQTYNGFPAPIITTTPASFTDGFIGTFFNPVLVNVGGNVNRTDTCVPHYTGKVSPWIEFSNFSEGPLDRNTGYPAFTSSVPAQNPFNNSFFTPRLSLPLDRSNVHVEMTMSAGLTNPPPAPTVVNAFDLRLDTETLVVPLHLYILLPPAAAAPDSYYTDFLVGSVADLASHTGNALTDVAWNLAQQIHPSPVSYPNGPVEVPWIGGVTKATKRFNPDAVVFGTSTPLWSATSAVLGGDGIFNQLLPDNTSCGVQLRLATVTFVRQDMGLETNLITTADLAAMAAPMSKDTTCPIDSNGFKLAKAYRDALNNFAFAGNTVDPRKYKGVHVFLGGTIDPNGVLAQQGMLTNGFTCVNENVSFVEANSRPERLFGWQTVFHEIGHILTGERQESTLAANLMNGVNGTLLTSGQCASIRTTATRFQ